MKLRTKFAKHLPHLCLVSLMSVALQPWFAFAQPQTDALSTRVLTALRTTELRSDKLGAAPIVMAISAGTPLQVLSLEGGWALVEVVSPTSPAGARKQGWVRASTLNFQVVTSVAAGVANGREAGGNIALPLGIRSLAPRAGRHALIIGISRYADPATPPLPGARIDRQSATQMAQAMQVPVANIGYLQDEQATGDNIRRALSELTEKVQQGDRVFIHYSGHGTRYGDPVAGGCVEALLAYEGGPSATITNREMADLLKTMTNKTDKLFVMYDACHSGGLAQAAMSVRTRGFSNANDEGVLRPKFASISEECGKPVNVKTRGFVSEVSTKGALPQDIIHVSASRENEISFDDELKGGLATQYMRDCMLRDAKDTDGSGAITIDEIRQCAQEKINKRMANDANYKAHNLVLNGNSAFVPAWFSQPTLVAPIATPANPAVSGAVPNSGPSAALGATLPALVSMAVELTGEQALKQLYDQRDAKRQVTLILSKERLKVGEDTLEFTVRSDRAGYVYVALAGSDNKSVDLLFPNELDQNNKIEVGQLLALPRRSWKVKAVGPVGTDNLLVVVADSPRNLTTAALRKAGPFVVSLNDAKGRADLGALMTSDAYGAAMASIKETK